jgi:hypothetical protein
VVFCRLGDGEEEELRISAGEEEELRISAVDQLA